MSIIYNTTKYARISSDEALAVIFTGVVASLCISVRDLLFERYAEIASLQQFILVAILGCAILLGTVFFCKIVAIRHGYVMKYRAHTHGLIGGVILTVISAGFLPLFLPGGFKLEQPDRIRVGKFLGFHKKWEVALIATAFPMTLMAFVLLISPFYLSTSMELFLQLMILCCLAAIGACVPLPMFDKIGHEFSTLVKNMHGTTFGLDVISWSFSGFVALCVAVGLFCLFAIGLIFLPWKIIFYIPMFIIPGTWLLIYIFSLRSEL
jgi:hypothetical protein